MERAVEELKSTDRAIAAAYVEKSGMAEDEVLRMMKRETWLTANQCVELGLVDEITPAGDVQTLAAAAVGNIRLTDDMINRIEEEKRSKAARKDNLISDLYMYGV
jgi:hypothetical protein